MFSSPISPRLRARSFLPRRISIYGRGGDGLSFCRTASQLWALTSHLSEARKRKAGPGLAGRDAPGRRRLLPKCQVSLRTRDSSSARRPPETRGSKAPLRVSGPQQASPWATLSSRVTVKAPEPRGAYQVENKGPRELSARRVRAPVPLAGSARRRGHRQCGLRGRKGAGGRPGKSAAPAYPGRLEEPPVFEPELPCCIRGGHQ